MLNLGGNNLDCMDFQFISTYLLAWNIEWWTILHIQGKSKGVILTVPAGVCLSADTKINLRANKNLVFKK